MNASLALSCSNEQASDFRLRPGERFRRFLRRVPCIFTDEQDAEISNLNSPWQCYFEISPRALGNPIPM
ncbi:unnamed protein product [Rhodiola kirilowii]